MTPGVLAPALVAAFYLLTSGTAFAGDAATMAEQCRGPAALASKPSERTTRHGDHRFDRPLRSTAFQAVATPVPAALRGAIRRVTLPPGKKLVALTFDLCETRGQVAGYDGGIIDYLRLQNVKATLFTGGKWMRSHPERIRQLMSDPLFEVANHSEAHRNLRLLSGAALTDEIVGPERSYEEARASLSGPQCGAAPRAYAAIPERLTLFRFPFGACNRAALNAVGDAGFLAVQWDVSTGDPSPRASARLIAKEILAKTRPGSIILAHANGRGVHTAEALPLAIPALRAKGYEFVTVSELLAQGTPEIATTCYDSRPGDTDKYDTFLLAHKARPTSEALHGADADPDR